MGHRRTTTVVAVVAVFAAFGALLAGAARPAPSAVTARPCSFQLRIGDVLPFTGDLAAYGANLDRAVKLAVDLQNKALKLPGLDAIEVTLVGSEDGQTQASASVEAATKLVKSDKANVVIGEMASSATIPMAHSVTIPNTIVQISPTSSAPQPTTLKDNGYLWRTYPSDTLQGNVLARRRMILRQGRDDQRRRAQRRVRHRAQAALRLAVEVARRQDRHEHLRGTRPGELRHRGAASSSRATRPGG